MSGEKRSTNPIFRAPKTRRLVSAWVIQKDVEHALERAREFEDVLDQVVFMCEHPKTDGTLPEEWAASKRRGAIARFGELGVSVLNDYSGVAETFAALRAEAATLTKLVGEMVRDCEETGADGVDIDFEHLPRTDRFAFTDFMATLAEALHERGKMLSICTDAPSTVSRRDWGLSFLDLPELARHVDHLRPMNYDMFGPWTPEVLGPTATAPWARDRMGYLAEEAPRHKLIMGLPTYSLDFDLTEPKKTRQVYDYEWIAEREKESSIGRAWIPHWDVSVMRYTDSEGHLHQLYVTDARSTRSHLATVDALDLAGICFWVLRGDDPAIWEAVRRQFART